MSIIRKHCEKCKKELLSGEGFYFQIYERGFPKNREGGFLCNKCCKKVDDLLQETKD